MKITCAKDDLAKGVQTVSKAVATKSTTPILECILIEADTKIRLTGNNLELGIQMEIDGEISEKGTIAVNAKTFSMIVRKLPEGSVTLETKGESEMRLLSGKVKYNLPIQSGKEYSRLPEIEKKEGILMSEFELKEAIRQTIFSVAGEGANKVMTGELFEINGKDLKVVSLDGHRIAIRNIRLGKSYEAKKVIVPGKTLTEIAKIISGSPEKMVWIYFTPNHILFEMKGVTAVSRLIEGNYFDVDRLITAEHDTKMVISKKELQECIDRAGVLQKEEKKPVVVQIKKDGLELKVVTPLGTMDEKIPIKIEGKELEIGFNPQFLLEMLRAIDDEEIEVYLKNAKSPCVIKDEEKSYLYLILPVNIKNAA